VNIVQIAGRLSRDPDLRYVGQNFPICNLNVAVEDAEGRWNRETKKYEVESGFYQVEVLGDYGAYLSRIVAKGDRVHVLGSLSQWRTQPREGRESETKTRIRGTVVTLLDAPREPRQPIQPPMDPIITEEPPEDPWAQGEGWR
jgi:single-stranded DNA-binding protein